MVYKDLDQQLPLAQYESVRALPRRMLEGTPRGTQINIRRPVPVNFDTRGPLLQGKPEADGIVMERWRDSALVLHNLSCRGIGLSRYCANMDNHNNAHGLEAIFGLQNGWRMCSIRALRIVEFNFCMACIDELFMYLTQWFKRMQVIIMESEHQLVFRDWELSLAKMARHSQSRYKMQINISSCINDWSWNHFIINNGFSSGSTQLGMHHDYVPGQINCERMNPEQMLRQCPHTQGTEEAQDWTDVVLGRQRIWAEIEEQYDAQYLDR